mgnify:CR=1 FL=1
MWNGKTKAITFSFDDGVKQDKRLIDILNKYGLKATFNLNSSHLGLPGDLLRNGVSVRHDKVRACEVKDVYAGHEVAVHTLTHPNLTTLDEETIVYQVESDRQKLSEIVKTEVVGMAYPCGGVNNDDRVAEIIKNRTGVKYARTITSVENFDLQKNLYRFNPSVYYIEENKMFELGERFLSLKSDKPQLFYIWGHSYEMDADYISWERFEEFCQFVSGKDDVFYGTNKEVFFK